MDNANNEPLTIQRAAIVRRVDALFRAMSSDFLLREQFVTDPAQILSEYVYSRKLPPDETAPINHLIYSVMSNRGLVNWLRDRAFQPRSQMQSGARIPLRLQSRRGPARQPQRGAGARSKSRARAAMAFDGALLSEILRTVLGFEDGTDRSPGGGGTKQSGTHVTEHSTGGGGTKGWAERAADEAWEAFLLRADATEHSPGGGGTQRERNPRHRAQHRRRRNARLG